MPILSRWAFLLQPGELTDSLRGRPLLYRGSGECLGGLSLFFTVVPLFGRIEVSCILATFPAAIFATSPTLVEKPMRAVSERVLERVWFASDTFLPCLRELVFSCHLETLSNDSQQRLRLRDRGIQVKDRPHRRTDSRRENYTDRNVDGVGSAMTAVPYAGNYPDVSCIDIIARKGPHTD